MALAVAGGLAGVVLRYPRRDPSGAATSVSSLIALGVFGAAVTPAPALNVTGVGSNVFAERYLFAPSIGFAWIAAFGWNWWAQRKRQAANLAGAALLAVFAFSCWSRAADWRDSFALLERTVAQSPNGAALHADLSTEYANRGSLDRAIAEAHAAVKLDPREASFRLNLGNLLLNKEPQEAAQIFETLIKDRPDMSDAHYCLGLARRTLGQMDEAAAEFRKAIEFYPKNTDALMALSGISRDAGDTGQTIRLCLRAARASPRNAEPQLKLVLLCTEGRQHAEAEPGAIAALRLDPDSARAYLAHYRLAMAYSHMRSGQAGLVELGRAIEIAAGFPAGARRLQYGGRSGLRQGRLIRYSVPSSLLAGCGKTATF